MCSQKTLQLCCLYFGHYWVGFPKEWQLTRSQNLHQCSSGRTTVLLFFVAGNIHYYWHINYKKQTKFFTLEKIVRGEKNVLVWLEIDQNSGTKRLLDVTFPRHFVSATSICSLLLMLKKNNNEKSMWRDDNNVWTLVPHGDAARPHTPPSTLSGINGPLSWNIWN